MDGSTADFDGDWRSTPLDGKFGSTIPKSDQMR